jgi:hypothetical protein
MVLPELPVVKIPFRTVLCRLAMHMQVVKWTTKKAKKQAEGRGGMDNLAAAT